MTLPPFTFGAANGQLTEKFAPLTWMKVIDVGESELL